MFLCERVRNAPLRCCVSLCRMRVFPYHLPFPVIESASGISIPFGAIYLFYFPVRATANLPCRTMSTHAILVEVVDTKKIVLVTGHPSLSPAVPARLHGVLA